MFDVTYFLSHTYKTYVTTPKLLRGKKIEKTNKLAFIEWTPLLLQQETNLAPRAFQPGNYEISKGKVLVTRLDWETLSRIQAHQLIDNEIHIIYIRKK